jgi:hypothetical protein
MEDLFYRKYLFCRSSIHVLDSGDLFVTLLLFFLASVAISLLLYSLFKGLLLIDSIH